MKHHYHYCLRWDGGMQGERTCDGFFARECAIVTTDYHVVRDELYAGIRGKKPPGRDKFTIASLTYLGQWRE